jgi:hypothetical protein
MANNNNTVGRNVNGRGRAHLDPFAPLAPSPGLTGTGIMAKRVDARMPGVRNVRDGRKMAKTLANQPNSVLDGAA